MSMDDNFNRTSACYFEISDSFMGLYLDIFSFQRRLLSLKSTIRKCRIQLTVTRLLTYENYQHVCIHLPLPENQDKPTLCFTHIALMFESRELLLVLNACFWAF